eukprot:Clim_evm5s11 gene=Clim_evmTU5s11
MTAMVSPTNKKQLLAKARQALEKREGAPVNKDESQFYTPKQDKENWATPQKANVTFASTPLSGTKRKGGRTVLSTIGQPWLEELSTVLTKQVQGDTALAYRLLKQVQDLAKEHDSLHRKTEYMKDMELDHAKADLDEAWQLTTENDSLRSALELAETRMSRLEQQLQSEPVGGTSIEESAEIKRLQEALEEAQFENEDLRGRFEQFKEAELSIARSDLDRFEDFERENKEMVDEIDRMKKELASNRQSYSVVNKAMKDTQNTIDGLRKKEREFDYLQRECQQLREGLQKAHAENQELQSERYELRRDVMELKQALDQLKDESLRGNAIDPKHEERMNELRAELRQTRTANNTLEDKLTDLKHEADSHKHEANEFRLRLQAQEQQSQQLQTELDSVKIEKEALDRNVESLNVTKANLDLKIEDLQQQVDDCYEALAAFSMLDDTGKRSRSPDWGSNQSFPYGLRGAQLRDAAADIAQEAANLQLRLQAQAEKADDEIERLREELEQMEREHQRSMSPQHESPSYQSRSPLYQPSPPRFESHSPAQQSHNQLTSPYLATRTPDQTILRNRISELEDELETLSAEHNDLRRECNRVKRDRETMQNKIDRLTHELQSVNGNLAQDKDALSLRLRQANDEAGRLRRQLENLETDHVNEVRRELEARRAVQEKYASLDARYDVLKRQNEEMNEMLSTIGSGYETKIQSALSELQSLKKKEADMSEATRRLQSELTNAQTKAQDLELANSSLQSKYEAITRTTSHTSDRQKAVIEQLNKELEHLRKVNEEANEAREKYHRLEIEVEVLRKDLHHVKSTSDKTEYERNNLHASHARLQTEASQLRDQNSQLLADANSTKARLVDLEGELGQVKDEYSKLQETSTALAAERDELAQHSNGLFDHMQDIILRMHELQKEVGHKSIAEENDADNVHGAPESVVDKLCKMTREASRMRTELRATKDIIAKEIREKKELSSEVKDIQRENKRKEASHEKLRLEVQRLNKAIKASEGAYYALQTQFQDEKERADQCDTQLRELVAISQSKTSEFTKVNEIASKERERLHNELNNSERLLRNARENLEDARNEVSQCHEEIFALKGQISALESKLQHSATEMSRVTDGNRLLQIELGKLRDLLDEQNDAIRKVSRAKADAESAHMRQLADVRAEFSKEIDLQRRAQKIIQEELDRSEDASQYMKDRTQQLEVENDNYRNEVRMLEDRVYDMQREIGTLINTSDKLRSGVDESQEYHIALTALRQDYNALNQRYESLKARETQLQRELDDARNDLLQHQSECRTHQRQAQSAGILESKCKELDGLVSNLQLQLRNERAEVEKVRVELRRKDFEVRQKNLELSEAVIADDDVIGAGGRATARDLWRQVQNIEKRLEERTREYNKRMKLAEVERVQMQQAMKTIRISVADLGSAASQELLGAISGLSLPASLYNLETEGIIGDLSGEFATEDSQASGMDNELSRTVSKLREELHAANEAIKQLRKEKSETEHERIRFENELKTVRREMASAQAELRSMEADYSEVREELETAKHEARSGNDLKLKEPLESARSELREARQTVEDLEARVEELEIEKADLLSKEEDLQMVNKSPVTLQSTEEGLKRRLEEVKAELREARGQIMDLETQLATAEIENEDLKAAAKEAAELAGRSSPLPIRGDDTLRKRVEELRMDLRQAREENLTMEEELQTMQFELDDYRAKMQDSAAVGDKSAMHMGGGDVGITEQRKSVTFTEAPSPKGQIESPGLASSPIVSSSPAPADAIDALNDSFVALDEVANVHRSLPKDKASFVSTRFVRAQDDMRNASNDDILRSYVEVVGVLKSTARQQARLIEHFMLETAQNQSTVSDSDNLDDSIAELRRTIRKSHESLAGRSMTRSKTGGSKAEAVMSNIPEMSQNLELKTQNVKQLKQLVNDKQNHIVELEQDIDNYRDVSASLQLEVKALKKQLDQKSSELAKVTSGSSLEEDSHLNAKALRFQTEDKVADLETEIKTLTKKLRSRDEKVEELQYELKSVRNRLSTAPATPGVTPGPFPRSDDDGNLRPAVPKTPLQQQVNRLRDDMQMLHSKMLSSHKTSVARANDASQRVAAAASMMSSGTSVTPIKGLDSQTDRGQMKFDGAVNDAADTMEKLTSTLAAQAKKRSDGVASLHRQVQHLASALDESESRHQEELKVYSESLTRMIDEMHGMRDALRISDEQTVRLTNERTRMQAELDRRRTEHEKLEGERNVLEGQSDLQSRRLDAMMRDLEHKERDLQKDNRIVSEGRQTLAEMVDLTQSYETLLSYLQKQADLLFRGKDRHTLAHDAVDLSARSIAKILRSLKSRSSAAYQSLSVKPDFNQNVSPGGPQIMAGMQTGSFVNDNSQRLHGEGQTLLARHQEFLLILERLWNHASDGANGQEGLNPHELRVALKREERRGDRYKRLYMRSESHRKSLCYQKRYLLMCISQFRETDKRTLQRISRPPTLVQESPKQRFRAAVVAVLAIRRLIFFARQFHEVAGIHVGGRRRTPSPQALLRTMPTQSSGYGIMIQQPQNQHHAHQQRGNGIFRTTIDHMREHHSMSPPPPEPRRGALNGHYSMMANPPSSFGRPSPQSFQGYGGGSYAPSQQESPYRPGRNYTDDQLIQGFMATSKREM